MSNVTYRAAVACFAATSASLLLMLSNLQQRVKAIALLAFLVSTASAQTVLSSGQLATCVNDGTVSSCASVTDLACNRHAT